MVLQIETKFRRQLLAATKRIRQYGVCIDYTSKQPELHGQAVNADNRVEHRFAIYALFLRKTKRRDAGRNLQSHEAEILIAAGVPFVPKPGDSLIDPQGKRYPVDDVRTIGPDGFPILYRIRCIDG